MIHIFVNLSVLSFKNYHISFGFFERFLDNKLCVSRHYVKYLLVASHKLPRIGSRIFIENRDLRRTKEQ